MMLGTLEKSGSSPVAGQARSAVLPGGTGTPVVAAFVSSARMERDCIRLLARTHPEVVGIMSYFEGEKYVFSGFSEGKKTG